MLSPWHLPETSCLGSTSPAGLPMAKPRTSRGPCPPPHRTICVKWNPSWPLLSNYRAIPQAEMGRAQTTRPQGSERQRTKSQLGAGSQGAREPSILPNRQYLKVHRGLTKAETEKLAQGLGVCVPRELTTYLGLYLCVI